MELHRANRIVGLMTVLLWAYSSACAEQPLQELQIEAKFPHRGDYMCVGFDSLWMMSEDKLLRIALADNAVTEITVKGSTGRWRRPVVGEGAIWVADNLNQTIFEIDPRTNRVVMTIPVEFPIDNEAAAEIAVGDGAVWAVAGNRYDQVLLKFSARTGAELAAVPLPSPSEDRGIVVDFGSVWVTGVRDAELYRIDPSTDRIVGTTELRTRPVALTSGDGSVWVRQLGGTVQRIDGNSGELIATIATNAVDGFGEIVMGNGFIWINSQMAPLTKIDPAANAQYSNFASPAGAWASYTLAYGGGSLWLGGSAVFRIRPPE